jgi:tetratricopeptide (TPR) repeat protein
MYCGTDIIVREAIQAGSGVNVDNYLKLARTANKAGNYQEAYNYYSKVLEYDINSSEAWFGKARAAGWLSNFNEFRDSEIKSGFDTALEKIPENDLKALRVQCASEINRLSSAYFSLIHGQVSQYASDGNLWLTYLERCVSLISLLEYGLVLNPNNQEMMSGIINICKTVLEGVHYEYEVQHVNSNGAVWHSTETGVRRVTGDITNFFTDKMNFYSEKMKSFNPDFKPPVIKRKYSTNEMVCICCIIIIVVILIFSAMGHH